MQFRRRQARRVCPRRAPAVPHVLADAEAGRTAIDSTCAEASVGEDWSVRESDAHFDDAKAAQDFPEPGSDEENTAERAATDDDGEDVDAQPGAKTVGTARAPGTPGMHPNPSELFAGLAVMEDLVATAFSSDTRMGSYFRSLFTSPDTAPRGVLRAGAKESPSWDAFPGSFGVFPCAPPAFTSPGERRGKRGQRVRRVTRMRILENQMTGLIFAALSFQVLGKPRTAPVSCRMGGTRTSVQNRAVETVRARVRSFVRALSDVQLDASCGRKAGNVMGFLESLAARELEQLYSGPKRGGSAPGERVRPVKPGRVDLPTLAGTFDRLAEFLPPGMAEAFANPEMLEKDDPPRPPRARMHCDDYVGLLTALDTCGMLEFERDADLPRGQAAGMFPVAKSADRDRLITNRRPRNSQEEPIGASAELFPHGCVLCELQLRPSERVRGSGDDLPDYYHSIRVSEERARTNQFGPPVRFAEVAHLPAAQRLVARTGPLDAGVLLRGLQSTLPMGDVNATDYGQVGHLNVLRAGGAARLEQLVAYRQPAPRGSTWELVMVDDHVVVQVVPRGAECEELGDDAVLRAADDAYAAAGLAPKESKRFRKQYDFVALGARVDGRAGWVSAKPAFMALAIALTTALARKRMATGAALASCVSLWGHILLFRRAGWCFLEHVYKAVARLGAGSNAWGLVERPAVDELLTVALLSPLLGTNIRAPVRTELYCTDACGGGSPGVGGTRAEVREDVAQELWRHRTRRGGYARAETAGEARARALAHICGVIDDHLAKQAELGDPAVKAALADLYPPSGEDDPRWFGEVCRCLQWHRTFAYTGKFEHINRGELRGPRTAVRRLIRSGHFGVRQLVGIDSSVVEGVHAKGRAAPGRTQLNQILRGTSADCLVCDIQLGILPVSSKRNPADAPSRRRRVSKPDAEAAPDWARRFVAGDLDALAEVLLADPRSQLLLR